MSTISAIIVTLNLVLACVSKMLLSSPRHYDEAMATWCGTSLGVSIMGLNDRGELTVCPEASHFAAGCGARTYADGVDTGGIIINTTANIPSVEATEAEYPVLYLFRRQLPDSGGAGRHRGGASAGVALVPWGAGGDLETSFSGVGAETPNAAGLAGGLPGASARYLRFLGADVPDLLADGRPLPGDVDELPGDRTVAPINSSHALFAADSIEYHNWQGGGGYGDPLERDPARVAEDVAAGLVSPGMAEALYGVHLSDGTVDPARTTALRDRRRADRVARGRPAAEALGGGDGDARPAWLPEEPGEGTLRYGDAVVFDFAADTASCLRCDRRLGAARDDFRLGCLVEEEPVAAAGPVRGQGYETSGVLLRRYACPGCGRQLEAEVTAAGTPRAAFWLAGGVP
jgi:N-methylhydantoinase B